MVDKIYIYQLFSRDEMRSRPEPLSYCTAVGGWVYISDREGRVRHIGGWNQKCRNGWRQREDMGLDMGDTDWDPSKADCMCRLAGSSPRYA